MERRLAPLWLLLLLRFPGQAVAQPSIDGGRSDLPGMKQDIFDRIQSNKNKGPQPRSKAPPECPKSDGQSAFYSFAFVSGEVFVRWNSTEGKCVKLLTIGGANYSTLINASRTCGPAGEFKRRIAENMSSVFFQAGLDWVKNENETIEIETEEGTFEVLVNEEKYAVMLECWKRACGCEQANNPVGRAILFTLAAIMIGGVFFDSIKLMLERRRSAKKKLKKEKKEEKKLKKKKKKDKDEDDGADSETTKSDAKSEAKSDATGDSETETKAESEGTDADTKKEDKEEGEGKDEEDKKDEKEE